MRPPGRAPIVVVGGGRRPGGASERRSAAQGAVVTMVDRQPEPVEAALRQSGSGGAAAEITGRLTL